MVKQLELQPKLAAEPSLALSLCYTISLMGNFVDGLKMDIGMWYVLPPKSKKAYQALYLFFSLLVTQVVAIYHSHWKGNLDMFWAVGSRPSIDVTGP